MKNIVFDFGNIIITFNNKEAVSQFTKSEEEQKFLIENAIGSPEWEGYGLIDSGYINNEEIANLVNDRTNNKHKDLVNKFMANYYKYMNIQDEVIEIIKKLKEKGYKIYLLSNTNEFMYQKRIKSIEYLFDGLVLSYRIHAIKPHDAIYKCLIDTYNLNPEETLFIDDRQKNIDTAHKFGLKGRKVEPDSVEDIRKVLKEYEIGE